MTKPVRGICPVPVSLCIAFFLGVSMALTGCYPRINDVTTDRDQPPVFMKSPPEHTGYNRDKYGPATERGYPDLKNLAAAWPPDEAFARVLTVIRRRGWAIAAIDEKSRRVQAVAVTLVFRFRDDVMIEVRTPPPGSSSKSVIAVRSKSRLGKGDFGANAKRIRAFFRDLQAAP